MRTTVTVIASIAAHLAVAIVLLRPAVKKGHDEIDIEPPLAGETFELPAPVMTTVNASPATDETTSTPSSIATTAARPSNPTTNNASSSGPEEEKKYGAVGERGTDDLRNAFERAMFQTASTDTEWASVALGDAGVVDVTLSIDDTGALVRTNLGGGGSPALRRAVERTLALIRARTFTATAPEIHVRIHARVTPDAIHDGSDTAVFALGMSPDLHTAFFSLAIGKRIDFEFDVKPIK